MSDYARFAAKPRGLSERIREANALRDSPLKNTPKKISEIRKNYSELCPTCWEEQHDALQKQAENIQVPGPLPEAHSGDVSETSKEAAKE